MNREHKNPQFEFLKPNHGYHGLFITLVEQYTKCLLPGKHLTQNLTSDFINKQTLLNNIIEKYHFQKLAEKERKRQEEELERESCLFYSLFSIY
jgi:splicing factor 3A subunit 1